MANRKYTLSFTLRGQKLKLTIWRLFRFFGYGFALTKLEKVK